MRLAFLCLPRFAILAGMMRLRMHRHTWIWFVVVAFTVTRLSDAHLHLCFDGSEPPAAVHMADGAVHDDAHHRESRHIDQDVSLYDTLLAKKDDSSADLAAVSTRPLLLLYVPVLLAERARSALSLAIPPPPFRSRPPPRGPPR